MKMVSENASTAMGPRCMKAHQINKRKAEIRAATFDFDPAQISHSLISKSSVRKRESPETDQPQFGPTRSAPQHGAITLIAQSTTIYISNKLFTLPHSPK